MKPGLIYRVGVSGRIDKRIAYSTPEQAIKDAYRLWDETGRSVAVYGYCEENDHTQFWRHWRITENGFISNR
jgi:hypothetical protein